MTSKEYFFYEWLIVSKGITTDSLKSLTPEQWGGLQAEYQKFLCEVK